MEPLELHAAADRLFTVHGLAGWSFGLSSAKRRLGVCIYRRRRIEIAEYYARHNPDAAVMDTLLHEIAHALAGPAAKHGPAWRAVAARLGATPKACDTSPDTVVEPGNWRATCPACAATYQRYKRPPAGSRYRCRCPARAALAFAYAGDPARRPPAPAAPGWHATCAGCGTVHSRTRRPKPGLWRCRCAARGTLTWAFGAP